ncbi:hypothetical protein MKK69_28805 [Methylobacterium sp. J-026]|uniref:hypothetical protein n=1 Tax=Methylobacterium sp. J-026 TaxID=2836624 RepID=UPI001FB8A264|nr:hypothetical protein [Methylobacterium sp. J-026]MCJ2138003.1 hypothetical protein [Methylobacterium sp. J-026]
MATGPFGARAGDTARAWGRLRRRSDNRDGSLFYREKIANNLITPRVLAYFRTMARRVYYWISDGPDGTFDAVVTIEPETVIRRDGFASLAEVEEWIDGLRILMAALGAPVAQTDAADVPASIEAEPDRFCRPGILRTAR